MCERSNEISEDSTASETESVFVKSIDSQKPKKYCSDTSPMWPDLFLCLAM